VSRLRVSRWLLGARDDLALDRRWWQRLLLVVFLVTTIAVGVFVGAVTYQPPSLTRQHIVVIATLKEYTSLHPEMANTAPSFAALGRVAFENAAGALQPDYTLPYDYFCAADLEAHPKEVAAFMRRADPAASGDMDVEKATRWLKELKASGETGNCLAHKDSDRPASSKIIAYRFATAAIACNAAQAALWAAVAMLAWAMLALNAYYRGVIYIIFGSRQPAPTEASSEEQHTR